MRRRAFLQSAIASAACVTIAREARAMTSEEIAERAQEYQRKALEHFPLKIVEATGDAALARWQELKSAGGVSPVVLGESLGNLLDPFGSDAPEPPQPVDDILRAAASMKFPDDLLKEQRAQEEESIAILKAELAGNPKAKLPIITRSDGVATRTLSRDETIAAMLQEHQEPPLGNWPDTPNASMGLTVASELLSGKPFPKVYIGVAPTDDWTTIPAILRWGGWNACPAAEYHVAALRKWRDNYGAELIGLSFDTMNLRVAIKPKTREEALALAREQYIYCSDIIDQGSETYSALAADLIANDWWYFWWD
ncbi:DUF4253 domain-containing protein [Aestuariivirga sp.]|uniref:DUF4253 domain-containing protein n=1 Tax=Aestuariivirga sp. TaxID=2650926 RepID=UPI0039E4D2C2